MNIEPMYWLGFFVVLVVIEIATMGLTTIWFAGGAIAGLVVNLMGGNLWLQLLLFLIVSFVLLIFTRPFAVRYINHGRTKTNVDELVGEQAVVTEEIDNLRGTGKVMLNGMDWTARLAKDAEAAVPAAVGTTVEITAIEGVKVMVRVKR